LIDTIAAMIPCTLSSDLFAGGSVTEDFETGQVSARLWLNPQEVRYAPRFTYWRERGVLKLECSLPRMIGKSGNLTARDIDVALSSVDDSVRECFGLLPSVREWVCQRVDYVYEFDVHDSDWLLATYGRAEVVGMSRQDYCRQGVVWKQGNRWVKLYDKAREQADPQRGVRLEVSNYADAVKYMSERWFGCERVVRELVHVGRALFVLAKYYELIGLHQQPSRRASVLRDLRERYGHAAANAWYVMTLMDEFGVRASELELVSGATLARWRKRLRDDGVSLVGDGANGERVVLPVREVVEECAKNLNSFSSAARIDAEQKLREILGLTGAAPGSWLMLEFLKLERV